MAISSDDWERIRADREASGASFADLSARHSVSVGAIHKRAKAEGWSDGQDVVEIIRRKVNERTNGIVNVCDPKKKAEAISEAADRVVAVVERHKQEWVEHKNLVDSAVSGKDFEIAKLAKITAETIQIRQAGERKAWGIERAEKAEGAAVGSIQLIAEIPRRDGRI